MDFATSFVFYVRLSRETCRGVEILLRRAHLERTRAAVNVDADEHGQEDTETALAFFNRLVTLFLTLFYGMYCICCNVNRYQNSPAFSDCQ